MRTRSGGGNVNVGNRVNVNASHHGD